MGERISLKSSVNKVFSTNKLVVDLLSLNFVQFGATVMHGMF